MDLLVVEPLSGGPIAHFFRTFSYLPGYICLQYHASQHKLHHPNFLLILVSLGRPQARRFRTSSRLVDRPVHIEIDPVAVLVAALASLLLELVGSCKFLLSVAAPAAG